MRLRSIYGTSTFRLALLYAGVTGVSFALLFAVIFWSTSRFMRHQIDDSVANELNEIMSEAPGDVAATRAMVAGLARESSGFVYLFEDARGQVLAGNVRALPPRVGVFEWDSVATQADRRRGHIRGRGVRLGDNYLFVGWSTHQLHEMEAFIATSFIWSSVAAIAVALAGGAIMSGRLVRKIETVSATSRNIIRGDLTQRVPVAQAGDEFDRLSLSVNAMLDRIETLMRDLRQVTTDIAHDLRTPLTRLGQRLEYAVRSNADAEALRRDLAAARGEVDDILAMFAAILRIAEVESGARKAAFAGVDLDEVVDTVVEVYRSSAEEKRQQLEHRIDPERAPRATATCWSNFSPTWWRTPFVIVRPVPVSRYRRCARPARWRCRCRTTVRASPRRCAPRCCNASSAWKTAARARATVSGSVSPRR